MKINELINRPARPAPWGEGEPLPWNDPAFSERMLKEHLSQNHDLASRRFEVIDQHVAWIHRDLLGGKASRILDLGCGPGLYAQRLARLGHTLVGIDFGPAALRYARETAEREGLACSYLSGDLRQVDFGTGFDLVMQIFGELNVFKPADAQLILRKAHAALNSQGQVLMEVENYAAVRRAGEEGPNWHSAASGLFSDHPYLFLGEAHWDEETRTTTERMYILDGQSAEVRLYGLTYQAYTDAEYAALFEHCGFGQVQFFPGMGGDLTTARGDHFPILARKNGLDE